MQLGYITLKPAIENLHLTVHVQDEVVLQAPPMKSLSFGHAFNQFRLVRAQLGEGFQLQV